MSGRRAYSVWCAQFLDDPADEIKPTTEKVKASLNAPKIVGFAFLERINTKLLQGLEEFPRVRLTAQSCEVPAVKAATDVRTALVHPAISGRGKVPVVLHYVRALSQ